jgi:GTPase SAR1 family protein
MYDVTSRETFHGACQWHNDLGGVACVLVANKNDLRTKSCCEDCVTTKEGEALAEKFDIPFFEISAKHKDEVNQVMEHVAKMLFISIAKDDQDVRFSGSGPARGDQCGDGAIVDPPPLDNGVDQEDFYILGS